MTLENWTVVGTPDLDRDGRGDILFQHKATGAVYFWTLGYGQTINQEGYLFSGDLSAWTVVAATDLNGDGFSDVLLQNKKSGAVYYWLLGGLNGTSIIADGYLYSGGLLNWKLAGLGDLNGDGRVDILWQNKKTGGVYYWLLGGIGNSPSIASSGDIFSGSIPDWKVVDVK